MSSSVVGITKLIEKDSRQNARRILCRPSELDPATLSREEMRDALMCGGHLVVEHWCDWALREIVQGRWDEATPPRKPKRIGKQ